MYYIVFSGKWQKQNRPNRAKNIYNLYFLQKLKNFSKKVLTNHKGWCIILNVLRRTKKEHERIGYAIVA